MALPTLLFVITNLAVVLTISLILSLLTSVGVLPPDLPLFPLLVSCFAWGVIGAWISLQLSADSAKRLMGIQLVSGGGGSSERWLHNTVARLAEKAGLPMPEVGIYGSPDGMPSPPALPRSAPWWPSPRASCKGCRRRSWRRCSATR
jgi:heat shock protein HtpX